jgi:hypothetical protein
MKLQKIILVLLFLLASVPICFGQVNEKKPSVDAVKYFDENKRWYNEFTEHWFYFNNISENDIRDSIIHWEQIGKDLENTTNEWSGTFGNGGETHGDYLRWSEKSGFIWLRVNKCQGGPMQIIRGKVSFSLTGVQLIPESIFGEMGSHGKDHSKHNQKYEFLFVRWYDVPFLIEKRTISDFADYTAGLGEFNENYQFLGILGSPFFSKLGVEYNENADELPKFPKGYEKFIKKPVKAKIIAIGKSFRRTDKDNEDWEELITEVKLDAGKNKGAISNLFLHFVKEEEHWMEKIIIKRVGATSSWAQIIRSVRKKNCVVSEYNDCENFKYTPIKIGLELSTTGN